MDLSSLIVMPDLSAVNEVVAEPVLPVSSASVTSGEPLTEERLAFIDHKAATMTPAEWMLYVAYLRSNPEVAMKVLGMDSTDPGFDERIEDIINERKSVLSAMRYRAQQDKPLSQSDSTTYMRTYIKNQSGNYYQTGRTWKWANAYKGQDLIDEYTRMSTKLGDPSKPKLYHLCAGSKRAGTLLDSDRSKQPRPDAQPSNLLGASAHMVRPMGESSPSFPGPFTGSIGGSPGQMPRVLHRASLPRLVVPVTKAVSGPETDTGPVLAKRKYLQQSVR